MPVGNWLLYAGVLILMLTVRSSERLAVSYGRAVTGTLVLTTCLGLVSRETPRSTYKTGVIQT